MYRVFGYLSIVIYTLVFPASTKAVDLLNGSFESGPAIPGLELDLGIGSTSITGWTVITGGIDLVGTRWPASNGSRSIDLNGSTAAVPGGISQSFTTAPGQLYSVQFDMAGNPGFTNGSGIKNLRVDAAGTFADFSFDTTGRSYTDIGWVTRTWNFTATDASTTLTFVSLSNGTFFGPTIDNVRVVAVPEPGSIVMISAAAVTLLVTRKLRRQMTNRQTI